MRRVTILGHAGRMQQAIHALHELGVLEITSFEDNLADGDESGFAVPADVHAARAELDSAIADLSYAIEFMAARRHVKKSMLENFTGSRTYLTPAEWKSITENATGGAREFQVHARGIEQGLADIADARNGIHNSIAALQPWAGLDSPVETIRTGKYVSAMLVVADARTYEESLASVAEKLPGLAWQLVSLGRERAQLLVAYPASAGDQGATILSSSGFSRVSLEQYPGVPALVIAGLESELHALDRRWADLEAEIDAMVSKRAEAYAIYDYLVNERAKCEVVSRFGGTTNTFAIEGWTQADDMDKLRACMEALSNDTVVLDREPSESEVPPVELKNGRFAAPFEVVTKTMGLPQPGTLDPTPYLAPFFLIFFGLAMTDAAYGIFIAAAAIYLKRKTRQPNSRFLNLIFMSGVATIAIGALLGGWLGDLPARLWGVNTAILFDPMVSPTTFLILSFSLGLVHILFGVCLKAYYNLRTGHWLSALYDQGFWLTLIFSLLLIGGKSILGPGWASVTAVAPKTAIAAAVGLVLTQGRHHPNPLKRLGSGIISLYAITGYMSDVISYARLFGLGFTSTVLASVLNGLVLRPAGIPLIGPILCIIGLAFSHLFNIIINIIGAYVHSSRLQYIEFFGKFFDSGGRRFLPFRFAAKYVDIDSLKGV